MNKIETLHLMMDNTMQACGITDMDAFFSSTRHHYVHARWLYFYTIRHFLRMTYENMLESIDERFEVSTPQALTYSVNKMSSMIDSDREWRRRWNDIKEMCGYEIIPKAEKTKITIIAPKDIEIEIKRKGE